MNPSQTPKRKSTSEPSTTDEQQTPPARVRIISPSPDGSYHHAFEPSSEFKTKRDHFFKTMPQKPNLAQLGKCPSPSALKGFRMVLDVDFVDLAEKLSETVDPIEFPKHIEEYNCQLETLEQNGYDVEKLRERFNQIKRCLVEAKTIKEKIKGNAEERSEKNVKACITMSRIENMKRELKLLETGAKVQMTEIQSLDLVGKSYDEELGKVMEELSPALVTWKYTQSSK